MKMTNKDLELLEFGVKNGTINLSELEEQREVKEREKYLEKHLQLFSKWQNKTSGYWYTYLPDATKKNGRRQIKKSTEEKLVAQIVAFWKQQEENPTVDEVFNKWNDYCLSRQNGKPSTHMVNSQIYNRFYSGGMGKRRIRDIKEFEWEEFLCGCIAEYHLTAKAFSNLKGITKGFMKWARKRKIISIEVEQFFREELDIKKSDFKKVKKDDSEEIFYDDEIEKIMQYIRENPDSKNLGIALLFVTGLRVGELVALKHDDIEDTTVSVTKTETRYRNNETKRYVYYVDDAPKTQAGVRTVIIPTEHKWILEKLKLTNPMSDYIFLDRKGNRMTTPKIRQRLYRICKLVGIPPRSPHKIRKTYGSILLNNNLDKRFVTGQMGHTNIKCTEDYYHKSNRRFEQMQAIVDNIPEFMAK